MSEKSQEITESAEDILEKPDLLKATIDALEGASRRARQNAAAILGEVARRNIELLVPFHEQLVDALNRPEARTRWECLDILSLVVEKDSRVCDKAIPGAEAALFDEESGPVRLAAMRFLCKLGATTEMRSEKTWPLIDEGIQCYHGDLEFGDMLNAVIDYSRGKLSARVKQELAARMAFDATNSKGSLKRRAQQILDNVGITAEQALGSQTDAIESKEQSSEE